MTPKRTVLTVKAPKARNALVPLARARMAGPHKSEKSPGRSAARQGHRKDLATRLSDFA